MTRRFDTTCLALALLALLGSCITAKSNEPATIPAGSKVYVAPMDGFETYFKAALDKEKGPASSCGKQTRRGIRNYRRCGQQEGGRGEKNHYGELAF